MRLIWSYNFPSQFGHMHHRSKMQLPTHPYGTSANQRPNINAQGPSAGSTPQPHRSGPADQERARDWTSTYPRSGGTKRKNGGIGEGGEVKGHHSPARSRCRWRRRRRRRRGRCPAGAAGARSAAAGSAASTAPATAGAASGGSAPSRRWLPTSRGILGS